MALFFPPGFVLLNSTIIVSSKVQLGRRTLFSRKGPAVFLKKGRVHHLMSVPTRDNALSAHCVRGHFMEPSIRNITSLLHPESAPASTRSRQHDGQRESLLPVPRETGLNNQSGFKESLASHVMLPRICKATAYTSVSCRHFSNILSR